MITIDKRGISVQQAVRIKSQKNLKSTKLECMRVKRNLSQSKLSELSGVPVRSIQCYEQQTRGVDSARLDTLLDLCIALDCRLEDILENNDNIYKLRKLFTCSNDNKNIEPEIHNTDNNEHKTSDEHEEEKRLYIKFFNNKKLNDLTQDQKDGIQYEIKDFSKSWQEILYFRYVEELTLAQISERKGITGERVRQILSKAVERLKKLETSNNVIYGLKTYQEMIAQEEKKRYLFDIPIDELKLSGRAYNCLMRAGLTKIGAVVLSRDKLFDMKKVGKGTVDEILTKTKEFVEAYNREND